MIRRLAPLLLLAGCSDCSGDDASDALGTGDTGAVPSEADPTVSVELEGGRVRLQPGDAIQVGLEVTRAEGSDDEVFIELFGLPAGVTAGSATLPPGATVGALSIEADATADLGGPFLFTLRATTDGRATESTQQLYVAGAYGARDVSFHDDGRVVIDPVPGRIDAVRGVAVDSLGRTLIAGVAQGVDPWEGWVVRLDRNGDPDTAFGPGGVLRLGPGTSVNGVAIRNGTQPVLLTIDIDSVAAALRGLNEDGTLDPSFGDDGTTPMPLDQASGLEPLVDGFATVSDVDIGRVDQDGHPVSFDPELLSSRSIISLRGDAQGRLLVGLDTVNEVSTPFFGLRLLADGRLDPSFGTAGVMAIDASDLTHDQKIVGIAALAGGGGLAVLGEENDADEELASVVRFDEAGEYDPSYGSAYGRAYPFFGSTGFLRNLIVLDDDRSVLSGRDGSSVGNDYVLVGLTASGQLDGGFGVDGGKIEIPQLAQAVADERVGGRVIVAMNRPDEAIEVWRLWQ